MFIFLIILHVIICLVLITIILLQPGEGQGLSDTLGGGFTESILGSRASTFLTKATTILAILFFAICLSVTILSAKRGKSLIQEEEQTQTKQSEDVQKTQEEEDVKKPISSSESPESQPVNKE